MYLFRVRSRQFDQASGLRRATMGALLFLLVLLIVATTDVCSGVSVDLDRGEGGDSRPTLPTFLGGPPEDQQVRLLIGVFAIVNTKA